MNRRARFAFAALAFVSSTALAAQPTDPSNAAIFAGGNITFSTYSTVAGGPVVANGNVLHNGGSLEVPSLYGGGNFIGTGGFQDTGGDVLFNGTITDLGGPGSIIGGNVTSAQGSVFLRNSSQTVKGNVTAALDVTQPFSISRIEGSILAGGNVTIAGDVNGNITYGGTYTPGTFTDVGGTVAKGGAVSPTAYQPLSLPAGRNLVGGSNNITLANFEDRTLAPGTYGNLNFASSNTVSLSAGDYVFKSINNTFSLNELSFDTSSGPIRLFVDGDFNFNMVQVVNGIPLFTTGERHPQDSLGILFEVDGSFTTDAELYGTIFAPNGDITLNSFAEVTGRVLAGGNVTVGSADVTAVPEPAALVVLAVATGGLLARRRRLI